MNEVEKEGWTRGQLKHHRLSGSLLVCAGCKKAGHSTKGRSAAAQSDPQCAACRRCKSRNDFDKKDLNNKHQKEKAGTSFTLVCSPCKTRERELIKKLDTLHAGMCPRSCGTQLFRHSDSCKAKFRVRITEGFRILEIPNPVYK